MKSKLVVIFPLYPTLQSILTYDIILGLQCLDYDVCFIALGKSNYTEHSYFKNKCKIFYLDKVMNKLSSTNYIIYGIKFLISSFYISIFFLLYSLKNANPLKKAIALLKFKYTYKLRSPLLILAQSSITTSLYGTFLKKIIPQSKLIFEIQSYYGQIMPINIKQLNYYVPHTSSFIIKHALKNIDLISSMVPEIYLHLSKIYKDYNIKVPFSFTFHKIPIAFSYISNKLNNTNFKVVFVSHLNKLKAVKEALISMDKILQNHNIQVNIIGDGEQRKEIEEWIRAKKFQLKVRLLGIKDRIETLKFIDEADVLIHNSYLEGGPIVLFEALMCGTIPIIRETGMVKYCIKHGYNGFIIDDDKNTIELILDKILKNPAILLQMRRNISIEHRMNINFESIIKKIHYSLLNLQKLHPYSKIKLKSTH